MESNPPCPLLPTIAESVTAAESRALRKQGGEAFYELCLRYAQTKWMARLPAQALLQLNRAMAVKLNGDEAILSTYPIPYRQMAWLLEQRPDQNGQFLGNPRRHWQHYATRMSGPHAELRTWRAWACHAIGSRILPHEDFPNDAEQIATEGVVIPDAATIAEKLTALGLEGECRLWQGLLPA